MTHKTANKKPQDSGLEPTAQKEPIAIIGIGCRYPGGVNSPESFWRLLANEVDAITNIPPDRVDVAPYYDPELAAPGKIASSQGGFLEDVDQFDASFFGISPREANFMDPQQRLLLETAWEALENAGQLPESLKMSKTGVFMGVWTDDYTEKMYKAIDDINLYVTTGGGRYAASGRLSYFFGFQGPSLTVDTACSSSLVTVHLACQSLREGESTLALAGGVNVILEPSVSIGYSRSKMLSPDGRSKFGDAKANGYVRSEGVGIVVLKRLSDAIADGDRIYAVIRGSAVNNDGRSSELLVAPGVQSQIRLLREAYENAGVDPSQVGYVEAHGTGTPVGDPVELEALGTVLSQNRDASRPCRVGSVKTNIGHTEAASGVAGLIKVALILNNKTIPASLHFKEPNPKVPWSVLRLEMQTKLAPWPTDAQPAIASVNSFGITGTNAHVVLTEAPQVSQPVGETTPRAYLLPLSAKTAQGLRTYAESLVTLLSKEDMPSLHDLAYTMSRRRTHHTERLAVTGKTAQELVDQLSAHLQKSRMPATNGQNKTSPEGPVFVFSGQGAQWIGMGRELMELEPIFKETICKIDRLLVKYVSWSLIDELLAPEGKSRLAETEVAQPAIFAVQLGLTALWKSWGIRPKAVVGHSVGEIAAAYVAGAFSLEDAVLVVYHRSRLMQRVTGQGKMAAVGLSAEQAEVLANQYTGLSVGAVNSPISTVLSGNEEALKEILASLTAQGKFARMLPVNYAFHSPVMDSLTDELTNVLQGINSYPAELPLYSTVRGERSRDSDYDAEYWARNIRQPVLFSPAIKAAIADGFDTFIEVSPHPVLFDSIGQSFEKDAHGTVVATLVRNQPEHATVLTSLGSLYKLGFDLDWAKLYPNGAVVSLPGYPWQRERYWFDAGTTVSNESQSYLAGKVEHPLLGYRLPSLAHLSGHHVWQNKFPTLRRYLAARDSQVSEPVFQEMALAAANMVLGSKNHSIRDLHVIEPLKSEGSEQILQSTLVQNASTATFELYSRENETADWRHHLTVNLQIGDVDTDWFYNLTWQASDSITPQADELLPGSQWLILSDQLGLGTEFASRLKDRNVSCTVVPSGEAGPDFDRILEGLNASSTQILYLWGLEATGTTSQTPSVESLISLIQAVTRRNWSRTPALFVVTQGAQAVAGEQPQLEQALLWGLGRVLTLEYPDLFRRIIDLPAGQAVPSLVDTLWTELGQQDAEDQVVYREGQRYVYRLVPAVQSASVTKPFTLTADGTYLVTGGLGMLGLQISRWLADHGARHLVLTGRSGLPTRSEWASIASDTLAGQRIAAVQALETMGVQVCIASVDVTNETAMRQLFTQFGTTLPALRGVIHAAGTNANQTLADLDLETWRAVLKPKVDGAWILHNLTAELPLEFFVCFSSAASVWGSQGMAPYVTANHFLDQLAQYRRAQHLPALTVNWGWWAGDGIATTEQSNLFAKVGISAMPAEKALAAMAHLIELNITQQVVADIDWRIFAPIYASRRERPFLTELQIRKAEKTGSLTEEEEKNSVLGQLKASSPEKQREMLTDYVRQLTAEILGFEKSRALNTREGFFKMGMDSLMTVQLRTRLEETLNCVLPHTIAFEHPTITQMAEYLAKNVLDTSDQPTASKAESDASVSETDLELETMSEDDLLSLLDDELSKVDDLTK